MGVVIRFEPKRDSGAARLEEELAVSYDPSATGPQDVDSDMNSPGKVANAEIRLGPAVAILVVAVMAMMLVAFHLTDRREYSARSNLLPSEFRIID